MMFQRILLFILAILILTVAGCRSGEFKADLEIYEAMPGLLEEYPAVTADLARNEDGTLKVYFEKGEMHIWFRAGRDMDVVSRQEAASTAFEIFHAAYMQSEVNKRAKGGFYREKIFLRGFMEDIELYVIEWGLEDENPNVISNREGNFF